MVVLRSQASSAIAAFETLGQKFAKPTVLVEDNLAAEIVRAAIRTDPQLSVTTICVQVLPGGANGLKRAAIDLALSTSASVGIIFDGDQLMAESIESSRVAEDNLNSAILRFAGSSVEKTLRGMASGSAVSSDDPRRVFVDWWHSHVSFLPSSWPPEDWLTICVGESQANENYWVDLATTELSLVEGEKVNSDDILATQRRCLARLDPAHLAPVVASVRAVLGI